MFQIKASLNYVRILSTFQCKNNKAVNFQENSASLANTDKQVMPGTWHKNLQHIDNHALLKVMISEWMCDRISVVESALACFWLKHEVWSLGKQLAVEDAEAKNRLLWQYASGERVLTHRKILPIANSHLIHVKQISF